MSHSIGEVFDVRCGHRIAVFEYNGTSDQAISCLHDTFEQIEAEWRQHEWKKCVCGKPSTPILLHAHYGGQHLWRSSVCLGCRAITGQINPWDEDSEDLGEVRRDDPRVKEERQR